MRVVYGRVANGIDDLEEYFERFWGIVHIDDREYWRVGFDGQLRDREHASEHWGCEGENEIASMEFLPSRCT